MSEERVLHLARGQEVSVEGLTIRFADSGRLDYSSSPPAGFIVLELEAGAETERLVKAQRHWGSPEVWNGYEVTILNEPEIAPKTAVVRVRRIAG